MTLALVAWGGDGAAGPGTHTLPQTTAIGTSIGATATQMIGAVGGSLTSGDGQLTVTIPSGVLATATSVTIEPITDLAPWSIGPAYRLGPAGLTFASPVSIDFHYDESHLVGTTPELLWVVSQDSTGAWPYAGAVVLDTTAHTITVASTHFSDWSIIEGMQIRPPSAEVEPSGSVGLTLRYCFGGAVGYDCGPADPVTAPAPRDDDLPNLPPALGGIDATSWAVNGATGGSSAYGIVAGTRSGASYSAPSTAPDDKNPVAVSVRLKDANGRTVSTLVSNIKVGGEHSYHAVGSLTRTGIPVAVFLIADVTDNLEFDVVQHRDGGITVSNITSSPSTSTNIRVSDDAPAYCAFSLTSPFEFGTFESFTGGVTPSGFTLEFSGTTTRAAYSFYLIDAHGACSFAGDWPAVDDDTFDAFLSVDTSLFPHVGSDVVVLGTSDLTITNGWVFDIRRTQ